MMRKYNFKFLMKSPTRSESAKCGELHGFTVHQDAFLKSTLFLLAATLLTLGSFFSQAYGVSSAQYQEQEDFSYVSYKLEAVQVAEVLLEIGVSPQKVEEVLGDASLSEGQKLTLLFHETKGLWVFDTSKHGQPVILIACKWYQVICVVGKGVEEVADYTNRVVTSAADDIEEAAEEVADYANRVVTSARDDIEEILGIDDNEEEEKEEETSSQKDPDLPAERNTVKVGVLGVGVEHTTEKNTDLTGKQIVEVTKHAINHNIEKIEIKQCGPNLCIKHAVPDEKGNCCKVTDITLTHQEVIDRLEEMDDKNELRSLNSERFELNLPRQEFH